jgi:adenylate kinase
MESGGLISDDMMIGIVRQALTDTGAAGGFILDGFPRTSEQARQLNAILRDIGVALDAVLHIEAPTEELIRRITGRFSCKSCGKGYHKEFLLPKRDGVCDDCGGTQFSSRSDDNVHTLRARLKAYEEQTAPLVAFYRASDVPLYDIDGMAPIDRVTDAIFASLDRTA